MKLPPIDEITSVTQINEWIDRWEKECLHVNPKDPVALYDENGYIHPDSSIRDIYSTIDGVTELLCRIKSLNHKISGIGNARYTYPTYKDMKQWKSERISLYKELQELIGTPMSVDVDDNTSMPETHRQADFSHMKKKTANFDDIIQYPNKAKLKKRLHELIDGKSGADVGCVFLQARIKGYITRNPKQSEFKSEFDLIGSWSAIKNYMDDNNQNALERANRIVIFE